MEEDEKPSAWAMLGRSAGMGQQEIEELKARVAELERKVMMMQGETLGSIEALQRRVHQLENNKTSNSVLDLIPVEELNEIAGTKIGVWPEKEDYVDDGEVTKVVQSGFTYNADDTQEEEPEVIAESSHEECADAIVEYINEHGGVPNADWKKKGLVPDTYEYEDRKKVREILESKEGITYWKRNNMWWFWYKEEEGLDAAHTRAYGSPP
tara:strand:- start:42 stop:671 length:630 start_codon:yes stop_codon:yes gene_type:complete